MPLDELFTICLKYNKKKECIMQDQRLSLQSSDNDKFTTVKLEKLFKYDKKKIFC